MGRGGKCRESTEGEASAQCVNIANLLQRGFWSYPETRAWPHPGLGTQILSLPAKTVEDSIKN